MIRRKTKMFLTPLRYIKRKVYCGCIALLGKIGIVLKSPSVSRETSTQALNTSLQKLSNLPGHRMIRQLVEHPTHYTSHPSGIEAITITQCYNFNVGNAIKYLWRQGLKDGESSRKDLMKARQYIDFELKRIYDVQETSDCSNKQEQL